jgi:hypothetical protein
VAVVTKILGHGRVPFAERQGETLIEMVMRRDAVGNRLGIA